MGVSVLHTIAGLKDRAGGVARSVPRLCEALSREGCRVALVTQQPRAEGRGGLLVPDPAQVDTRMLAGYDFEKLRVSYTPNLEGRLDAICAEFRPQVMHDHGVWLQSNHAAARIADRRGIKRVVSPRGMLDEWSLSYRGWKKKLAWHVYQREDLYKASAFCATSRAEALGIRAVGFEQPIAVIPNGVEIPALADEKKDGAGARTVLFMSRLHPKKGLHDLVSAWAAAAPPGWRLVIAGPDEDGYGRVVEQAVRRANLSASVTFTGAVEGAAKRELLGRADVFVLPSYSENFGIVVGEALAHGVPVIASTATPWGELETERCGWWVDPGALPLEAALRQALGLPPEELASMGKRGRALVESRYSWRSIARLHVEFYEWLACGAPAPRCLLP